MASKTADTQMISSDMDYAQHQKTWATFTGLVKWAIFQLVFIVLALYCFIEAGQFWAGLLLLLVGLFGPVVAMFLRSTR